jgi:hypothetical protein
MSLVKNKVKKCFYDDSNVAKILLLESTGIANSKEDPILAKLIK